MVYRSLKRPIKVIFSWINRRVNQMSLYFVLYILKVSSSCFIKQLYLISETLQPVLLHCILYFQHHVTIMMSMVVQSLSLHSHLRDYIALIASVCRNCRMQSVKSVNTPVSRLSGIWYTLNGAVVHSDPEHVFFFQICL